MKKVIVGVSGSIAAYKAASLIRLLIKSGAEVRVLMTPAAAAFISPLTLSTLSKHQVLVEVVSEEGWNNHVELGLWADAYVIAPATANTLAKLANGICDNILTAVYLSARCKVFVAPAMDLDMWHQPATRRNLSQLTQDGVQIIPVGHGELASGLIGDGRMAEPEEIMQYLAQNTQSKTFEGKQVVITAGPTFEAIDPVRFVGNRSTGKMGIAIAEAFAEQGAKTTLVLGPTHLKPASAQIHVVKVQSAQEMFEATKALHAQADIVVFSAAVADYRPAKVADQKIKKKGDSLQVDLVRTIDIAATLGKEKREGQMHIGFALETQNELEYAQGKLLSKNFDLVVLNSLQDAGAGFGHDTNKVKIIDRDQNIIDLPLLSKTEVAQKILDAVIQRLPQNAKQLKATKSHQSSKKK